MVSKIVSGEKIQKLCDIYLGNHHNFNCNPLIAIETKKHIDINSITSTYNNPKLIFCYSHNIKFFSNIIHHFKNNFILITHNSDENIINSDYVMKILECPNLIRWFSQNICLIHYKLHFLPIGIANSQWAHGRITHLLENNILNYNKKNKNIYFNFTIETNIKIRKNCYELLKDYLEWLPTESPENNIKRLSEYKFCICPEGNGVDTHRLWECLYLKVVPIVINSPFTKILLANYVPLVVLNNWSELKQKNLNYDNYIHQFEKVELKNLLDLDKIREMINKC